MSNARKIANVVVGTEVKLSGVDSDLANTVSAIKSRLDSDDGELQSLDTLINSRVSSIKSRLDSDDGKLQQLDTLIKSNLSNLADSDLIVSQLTAKITSVISNLDSDTTGIQAANTQIQTIKNRLDSDDSKIQSLSILSQSALSVSGMKDSDLKVVSDLRNDLDSEILYVRNIALSYTNYIYTATAGQTTFSGTDDNSVTLAYTAGSILVFLNGIKIEAEDFTATDGTSIVLTEAASVNAQLVIVVPKLESNYVAPIIVDWGGMQTFEIAPNPPNTGHVGYSGIQIALSSTGEYAAVNAMDYTNDKPGVSLSNTGGGFIIYKNSSSDYSDSTAWDKVASKHSLPVTSGGPTGATFSITDSNNQRLGERPIWINEDASKVVIPHMPSSTASQWAMFVLSRADSDFSDYGSFNPYEILTDKGSTQNRMEGFLASRFDVDKNVERIAYHVPKVNSSNVFVAGIAIVKRTGTTWALEAQFDTHDAKTGYQTVYTNATNSPGMGKDGVVMSEDGDKIVCSSKNGAQNQSNRGAIWTFTRSGTSWSMPDNGTIYNPDSAENGFGHSISLSADGNYLAVICSNYSTTGSSVNMKIRTYEWNSGTSGWDELASDILMSTEGYGTGRPQWFGDEMDEVKISNGGNILTFNARYDDDSDGLQSNTGLIRIYKRSGSTWSLVNYKYGADLFSSVSSFAINHSSNHYINKLAMSDTGATIMASAPYLDTDIANGSGPTYGAIGILHDS